MSDQSGLPPEELEQQSAEELPAREQMSVVDPSQASFHHIVAGGTYETPPFVPPTEDVPAE
jgi:hypothetical protein